MFPKDFLDHARAIITDPFPPEVNMRSAVSRAYYSLFHESLEYLKTNYTNILANVIIDQLNERKKCDPSFTFDETRVQRLDENYISSNGVSLHGKVAATIKKLDKTMGKRYAIMKEYRNEADYRLNTVFDKPSTEAKLDNMEELIGLVKAL